MAKTSKLFSLLAIMAILMSLPAALASWRNAKAAIVTIINGDFETGGLSGWTVGGLGASVEVISADDFEPKIPAPQGNWFVLLSTGPGEVNLSSGPDFDSNTFPDYDTATLRQTFTLLPDQVLATLSFQWSFLSAEVGQGAHDDFFMVTLNGTKILTGSVPGAQTLVSPYPDVPPLDGIGYTVTSYGPTDGSVFDGGSCGFQDFFYVIGAPGSYTLEFVVADQGDRFFDSGLLIDAVKVEVPPPSQIPTPPIPTPRVAGGGGGVVTPPAPPPLVVGLGGFNLMGYITPAGEITHAITLAATDRRAWAVLPVGARALTADGRPLMSISIEPFVTPPPAPPEQRVIGLLYDLKPDGATFSPPITITFQYDPAAIPPGVREGDLVLAYYDRALGQWVQLSDIVVNPVTNTISGRTSHFTLFAVLTRALPLPVPTPVPTPTPPPRVVTPVPTPTPPPPVVTPVPTPTPPPPVVTPVPTPTPPPPVVTPVPTPTPPPPVVTPVPTPTPPPPVVTPVPIPTPPPPVVTPVPIPTPPPPPPVPPKPFPWGLVVGIVVAVLVVGGLVYYFLVRKRPAG